MILGIFRMRNKWIPGLPNLASSLHLRVTRDEAPERFLDLGAKIWMIWNYHVNMWTIKWHDTSNISISEMRYWYKYIYIYINIYICMYTYVYIYIYVHVYLYVYVYIYIYNLYMYVYICVYIYIYVHVYLYVYIKKYISLYVHIYIYTYRYVYVYVYVYICKYVCVYLFVCIYIYIYTYIYIYIWSPTELWKKNVQLRQAAPASDFSIIGFSPIRVQNIPEVIRTFFFP